MRRLRNMLIAIAALALAAVLYLEFVPVETADGSFELRVQLTSDKTVRMVRCEVCDGPIHAEQRLQDWNVVPEAFVDQRDCHYTCAVANPYDGTPVSVRGRVAVRLSSWDRVCSVSQPSALLVVGQFTDGQRFGKVVDIPVMRTPREMTVQVP